MESNAMQHVLRIVSRSAIGDKIRTYMYTSLYIHRDGMKYWVDLTNILASIQVVIVTSPSGFQQIPA